MQDGTVFVFTSQMLLINLKQVHTHTPKRDSSKVA